MLDKTNRTGSTLQIVNGVFLTVTFFSVRLIYGGFIVRHRLISDSCLTAAKSYQFFETLYNGRHAIPPTAIAITGLGNVLLQGLNWFWCVYRLVSSPPQI